MRRCLLNLFIALLIGFNLLDAITVQEVEGTLKRPSPLPPNPSSVACQVDITTGAFVEASCDATLLGAIPFSFQRLYNIDFSAVKGLEPRWLLNSPGVIPGSCPYLHAVHEDKQVEGSSIWRWDEAKQLISCAQQSPSGALWRTIQWQYTPCSDTLWLATAAIGEQPVITYQFSSELSRRLVPYYLLTAVNFPNGATHRYRYRWHPTLGIPLISAVEKGHSQILFIEYGEPATGHALIAEGRSDDEGKVKKISQATEQGIREIASFEYFLGVTVISYPTGYKAVYRYGADSLLRSLEYYLTDSSGNCFLYRSKKWLWQHPVADMPPLLCAEIWQDGSGTVIKAITWQYDKQRRVIETSMHGSLTGHPTPPPHFSRNSLLDTHGSESYSTRYNYASDDMPYPSCCIEESGLTTYYEYDAATFLLVSKRLYIGETPLRRYFITYNGDALPITIVEDNGSTNLLEEEAGVTYKKTTAIQYGLNGLPISIMTTFGTTDNANRSEHTSYTYSPQGWTLTQEMTDISGATRQVAYEQDPCGRIISCQDSEEGSTSYILDILGNISSKQIVKHNGQKELYTYVYDSFNHLIETTHQQGAEAPTRCTYRYDSMDRLCATSDTLGNETLYEYDPLGRLIAITRPCIVLRDGSIVYPRYTMAYDTLDRVVATTDPCDIRSFVSYNIRNQITARQEGNSPPTFYRYYLDGSLAAETNQEGITTTYTRNGFGQIEREEKRDSNGISISRSSYSYENGHKINACHNGELQETWAYDASGNCTAWIRYAGSDRRATYYSSEEEYKYEDNEISPGHSRRTTWRYNSDETWTLTAWTDTLSGRERYPRPPSPAIGPQAIERSNIINALGQLVAITKTVNQQGYTTVEQCNALDCVESQWLYDNWGSLVWRREQRYNASGLCTLDSYYPAGDTEKAFTKGYDYEQGLLKINCEGYGGQEVRYCLYFYDDKNRLAYKQKQDGTSLRYSYDSRGLVAEVRSSDTSIHYTYSYDSAGNLVSARDMSTGNTLKRSYNAFGDLISESNGNSCTMTYKRDALGRCTELALPDNSYIRYSYDALALLSIERYRNSDTLSYSYQYAKYNQDGTLAEALLPFNLGKITYTYDQGIPIEITSPYWHMKRQGGENRQKTMEQIQVSTAYRDPIGNSEIAYTFDGRGQLLAAETEQRCAQYQYDPLFNIIGDHITHNTHLELLEMTPHRLAYDPCGNATYWQRQNDAIKFTYDALDRLSSITWQGLHRITYRYDALNRRSSQHIETWKQGHWQQVEEGLFWHDETSEIAYCQHNKVSVFRLIGLGHGADLGNNAVIEIKGVAYCAISDERGNTIGLIDATGCVAEWYHYTPFGEVSVFDKALQPCAKSILGNPWQFAGKWHEENSGLVFFSHRCYAPDLKRWLSPDPLGNTDGPNPYIYAHNNPIGYSDAYGLWAIPTSPLADSLPQEWIHVTTHWLTHHLCGHLYHSLYGSILKSPEMGSYGQGESNDAVRITFINGLFNCRPHMIASLQLLSKLHGGNNIHYLFRHGVGVFWDLIRGIQAKLGIPSSYSKQLARLWKQMIHEMGGTKSGGTIWHYAHSLGSIDTKAAQQLMTSEELAMIHVITIGSPSLFAEGGFGKVTHFASWRDGVCLLDPIPFIGAMLGLYPHIQCVGTLWGIPFIDHLFESESYYNILQLFGATFLERYGYRGCKP